ncbi:MAG: hypothetical protein R6V47_02030 [Candidatus Delongbacteria bacterium]
MRYLVILILLFVLSAFFIVVRDKFHSEDQLQAPVFFDSDEHDLLPLQDKVKNKNSVIIFDVPLLTYRDFSDTLKTPNINQMINNSEVFLSTLNLSTERITSLKSFIECMPPYKFNDKKGPFKIYKNIISDSLRNSSLVKVFEENGYATGAFCADSAVYNVLKENFENCEITVSNKASIEHLYKKISLFEDGEYLYYVSFMPGDEQADYLKNIDMLVGEFINRIETRLKTDPLFVFISTYPSLYPDKRLSFFYKKDIGPKTDSVNINITDIAKTLFKRLKIKTPNYFGGYDIDNADVGSLREYFAGSTGDTLLLFNDSILYKQLKHSPEYFYYDLKKNKDLTEENIGINEKFENLMSRYFGGDYIKHIILKNREKDAADFEFEINSVRRFAELKEISSYYDLNKKYYRYRKKIKRSLDPGKSDTISIYYGSMYQNFEYKFNKKYNISYGAAGINAGKAKNFEETSYYGMKYSGSGGNLYDEYGVKIFNVRINY